MESIFTKWIYQMVRLWFMECNIYICIFLSVGGGCDVGVALVENGF